MQIMKKLLLLLAFISTPAMAAEKWEKLETTYQVLNAVDLIQTVSCLEAGTCVEANPIFGKRPKASTLIAAKVGGGVVHYIVTKHFVNTYGSDSTEAKIWLYGSIALQGSVVALNFRIIL